MPRLLADGGQEELDVVVRGEFRFDPAEHRVGALDARALRELDVDLRVARLHLGEQLHAAVRCARRAPRVRTRKAKAEQQDRHAVAQRAAQQPLVADGETGAPARAASRAAPLMKAEQTAGLMTMATNSEANSTMISVRGRNPMNWPMMSGQKSSGEKAAQRRQRRGDDRPGHLGGAPPRGLLGALRPSVRLR